MGVAKAFLKRLQKSLNGTVLCKDVLVVAPTEHILRGYTFDRTREKGMFHLWELVMPLYTTPHDYVYFNYSRNLTRHELIPLVKEEIDTISEQILEIVAGRVADLRTIRGPKEFLERNRWMEDQDLFPTRRDLALTHYMLGNIQHCLDILEELAARAIGSSFRPDKEYSDLVTPWIDDLRTDPCRLARKIEAWEKTNIEKLGLIETTKMIAH